MNKLLTALQNPALYPHPIRTFDLIETHISWVLLTGDYVYKIKKPVDLGFLDFSTLEKRRFYCEEEVRLNKRLAREIYLDVVAITGSPDTPAINRPGTPIEYAVKMRQFPQQCQLDRMLAGNRLRQDHITQLAVMVADFHQTNDVAEASSRFGTAELIAYPVNENFKAIRSSSIDPDAVKTIDHIEQWSGAEFQRCASLFPLRKQQKHIRECHGDMHLRNIACVDDRIIIFDCIEFNDTFRWIDTMSEVAFVVMDLDDRGVPELGNRFLNEYLQRCGDYEGLGVFRYYLVYRAMVRAKVDCIRARQDDLAPAQRRDILGEFRRYIALADAYTRPQPAFLIITHGLSGSGKTWLGTQLIAKERIIRIRSDIERKRLFNIAPNEDSQSPPGQGIYTKQGSERTYAKLLQLAGAMLHHGWPVLVDAAFLRREDRARFHALAQQHGVAFIILDIRASEPVLRARVNKRKHEARDASEATEIILDNQIKTAEHLTDEERVNTLVVDTNKEIDTNEISAMIQQRLHNS